MIELLMTACLISGGQCKEFTLTFQDVSVMQCLMAAQPEIAKWAEAHPKYVVTRWKCRPAGSESDL